MNPLRIVGVLLLVVGLAAFVWGDFGLTLADVATAPPVGPASALAPHGPAGAEPADLVIPQWMSLAAMVLGGMALVLGSRRR
jgi:hypothetical protein